MKKPPTNRSSFQKAKGFLKRTVRRDGSSIKTAIVLKEKTEGDGVPSEYAHAERLLGKQNVDWRLVTQSIVEASGRYYDLLNIALRDGTRRSLFFDITAFFGKLS